MYIPVDQEHFIIRTPTNVVEVARKLYWNNKI